MTNLTVSALASSLADAYARRIDLVADVLAWLNDSPDHRASDYAPGWDAPSYDPTPSDWSEYAAWSRSLDGGCGVAELSPEEKALLVHSASEDEYWQAEMDFAEYDSARDCEDAFAEMWA